MSQEALSQSEQPKKRSETAGDKPMGVDKVKIGERPITPAAHFWIEENNMHFWDYPDLRLRIINKAEDAGRQLTKDDLKLMAPDLERMVDEERDFQNKAAALERGLHKDRVVDIEVLHEPNYRGEANIRIRAITEQGLKVIIRTLKGGLDFSKISEKRNMAEEYARRLIGQEIEFYKMVRGLASYSFEDEPAGIRGQRVYLRIKKGTLPEFENLDYRKLKNWVGKK